MSPLVLGMVLVAAIFHASWNALLKAAENPLALATRAVSWGAIACLPPALAAWLVLGRPGLPPAGWLLVVISAGLELGYFIALSTAYQRGELSVVYPIARGTAPLLAVAVGLLVLREHLSPVALLGVLLLLAGIWAVRRPTNAGAALLPALLTGVLIAGYSSVDRVGVRLGPPWLYGEALWLIGGAMMLLYTRVAGVPHATLRVEPAISIGIGVLITLTYFMILYALSVAPLAIVAPLRESAIVLVTAWGIWRLRERQGAWLRLGGALAIVGAIGLLTLSQG